MKKYSLSALVAAGLLAGGLSVTSANAADLGGNCCADLEERIAELEATTARKGNRKVSLTISGWVAEQVAYYDDGVESNVYVSGIGTTLSSHVKFTGQATISPGWTAGYVLHLESDSNEPLAISNDNPNTGSAVIALQSYWFIKSEHLGKVSLGKQSQASDNTAILVDGSGSLVPANWVMFEGGSFNLNQNGGPTGLAWGDVNFCNGVALGLGGDCNGVTENVIRYDSPTFG
ncbi:MAG: porin, partial [Steroidobacteraceae bacterium]